MFSGISKIHLSPVRKTAAVEKAATPPTFVELQKARRDYRTICFDANDLSKAATTRCTPEAHYAALKAHSLAAVAAKRMGDIRKCTEHKTKEREHLAAMEKFLKQSDAQTAD